MRLPFLITIDGPAASGKTSLSRELARRLNFKWVSTGAFYRGLALLAIQNKVNQTDAATLVELVHSAAWKVVLETERTEVWIHGNNLTDQIHGEDVGTVASRISRIPQVRDALLSAQRSCVHGVEGLVAEGRDCGTIVFPQAQLKIFLTANSSSRAARRALEQGQVDIHLIEEAQKKRDLRDSTREVAPMAIPLDGWVIDTSELQLMDVVQSVEEKVRSLMNH